MINEPDPYLPILHSLSQSGQEILWRPWPCAACSKGLTPIGKLIGRFKASGEFQGTTDSRTALEVQALLDWVISCPHFPEKILNLPKLSSGSEHTVYIDASTARVFRLTLPGVFGDFYYLKDGKMNQENCTPFQYLVRLRLWKKIFGSAPKALGITQTGQILSEHEFIQGTQPEQSQVDAFLEGAGFIPVRKEFWFWEKAESSTSKSNMFFRLGDARSDNFVLDPSGDLVPIDIRLWVHLKKNPQLSGQLPKAARPSLLGKGNPETLQ